MFCSVMVSGFVLMFGVLLNVVCFLTLGVGLCIVSLCSGCDGCCAFCLICNTCMGVPGVVVLLFRRLGTVYLCPVCILLKFLMRVCVVWSLCKTVQ